MDGPAASQRVKSFEFTPEPAFAMLDEAVRRFGHRPAIDFLGKTWRWREIGLLTDKAAAGLQKLGVTKNVKIGLCLPNTPYSIIMFHAILKAGGTVVNFNPLYTASEIEKQAIETGTSMLVSLDLAMIHDKIAELTEKKIFARVIICSMTGALPRTKAMLFRLFRAKDLAKIPQQARYISFAELIAGEARLAPVRIDPLQDIAVLQFTGGTTGVPKAAMLSHGNIAVNVQQILRTGTPFTLGEERIIGVLPLFHVFAMTGIMNLGIALGAELILFPRMDLQQLMAAIFRRRPTMLPGVPTLFAAIGNAAEAAGKTLDFIKFCVCGGAAFAVEAVARFERISHCRILEGYGLSETSPVATLNPPNAAKPGSVGVPLPGTIVEIRDLSDPEIILPQGERGEICIRGPQVMLGYYNHPIETANAFVAGAFRTGDVGFLDADGYLFIVDRIKDLIICGGYKVYPRSIEEAAYLHPQVQDAIAIGIPDAYRGQAAKLFVTLRPDSVATPETLKRFLAEHLSRIELPREIEIRDTLPRTMVGKLSKKELVAEEQEKLAGKDAPA
jgi:long-chain acyl-CoA synthetase